MSVFESFLFVLAYALHMVTLAQYDAHECEKYETEGENFEPFNVDESKTDSLRQYLFEESMVRGGTMLRLGETDVRVILATDNRGGFSSRNEYALVLDWECEMLDYASWEEYPEDDECAWCGHGPCFC